MGNYQYKTEGVCSQVIRFNIDGEGKLHNVEFFGGCNGNLKAIGLLVEGRSAEEVANTVQGNTCGHRNTSCADQLAHAIKSALQREREKTSGNEQ
ncbi:MAG: TIGR03905 family TSCPD domain-containing protein [Paludibacteraceae bacterium]|nr:TIGR03905 family TSCPD domain-containing protein [Paludibacteraceae bacterium]